MVKSLKSGEQDPYLHFPLRAMFIIIYVIFFCTLVIIGAQSSLRHAPYTADDVLKLRDSQILGQYLLFFASLAVVFLALRRVREFIELRRRVDFFEAYEKELRRKWNLRDDEPITDGGASSQSDESN